MKDASKDSPNDAADRVSSLLVKVLQEPQAKQSNTLDEMCGQHPACAGILRRAWGALQQIDLAQVAHGNTGVAPVGQAPGPGGLPRTLGPFRLLEFLGAGGMGSVYRAEDIELQRQVALKMIRTELLASERAETRFEREIAALARLDHPGLCTVYRAGTTDGQPWISMRLVRGTTIAQQLDARREAATADSGRGKGSSHARDEVERTLALFERIARALATAHAVGVVHRDLKPGNIVLSGDGEPVVIDFGLVHLADSSHLTLSGDQIGTPAYMAPEQVEARGRDVTPATDVYALGVTLFEALTLASPYGTCGRESLFMAIVHGERKRLRQVRRSLPADLEVVLEKALDVDPRRRYATMLDFAEDLRRVRQHEPPAARRLGLPLRAHRWCQRNPVAATFLTLLSAGLLVVLLLDASRQRARERSLAMAYGNLAGQVIAKNSEHALELALRGVDRAPDDPETLGMLLNALGDVHRHEEWPLGWPPKTSIAVRSIVPSPRGDAAVITGYLNPRDSAPPVLWTPGGCFVLPIEKGTFDATWSPDGSRFLTTCAFCPPQLWTASGEPLPLRVEPPGAPPQVRIPRARFLPDGEHVVFACGDGKARILALSTATWTDLLPPLSLGERKGMPGLAVSADGGRLALGDYNGLIVVHEVAEALAGRPGRVLTTSGGVANALDLGVTGEMLHIETLSPQRCELWTWQGARLKSWGSREAPATPADLEPLSDHVIEVARDHAPRLWRLTEGKLELRHELCKHDGTILDVTHDGSGRILSLGIDGMAQVTDAATGRTELQLRGFDKSPSAGAFLPTTNQLLVVAGYTLHRFDLSALAARNLPVGVFGDRFADFGGAEWNGAIVTADINQNLSLHDTTTGKSRATPEPGIGRRAGLAFSSDRRWLVSTSNSLSRTTMANLYGPGLEPVQTISDLDMERPEPTFGPDNQLLLVDIRTGPGGGGALFLPSAPGQWGPAPAEAQETFVAACNDATAAAYHAATATLAIARNQAGITLYEWTASPPSLRQGPTLLPNRSVRIIAFAPDGQQLLFACMDRVVRLVDRAGRVLDEFEGHLGFVENIEFSPRGDRFLIAGTQSGITVHDRQGRLLLPIRPEGAITMARFLPAGDQILYGDSAGKTRIVPIDRARIVDLARSVKLPPMSEDHDRHYRSRAGDESDR